MFQKMLKKMCSYELTVSQWLTTAVAIILIRIFLEQYSNNLAGHYVLTDFSTITQYTASFFAVLLMSMVVLLVFTKKSLKEVSSLSLSAFPVIWLAPLLDIILSAGKGYRIHYIFLGARDLCLAFITEFWSTTADGMTIGIRLEVLVVIVATFFIIREVTHNRSRAILGTLSMWACIFLVDCIPSFLGLFQHATITDFIDRSISYSNIITNSVFSLQTNFTRLSDIGFNSLMLQVNLYIAFIALSYLCYLCYREKALYIIKNARPERILHYTLLIVVGVILGTGKTFFSSWVNVSSLIMTMIAFTLAWISAVCINDIEDLDIDIISNSNRPLPRGIFSKGEFLFYGKVFFVLSLITAYSASLYGLFFVCLFSSVYYLYSLPPVKLKRNFVTGALVIGVASISAVMSGYFLSMQNKELFSFPPLFVLTLVVLFGFGSMVKDLKDYEGDKALGIKTLPVVIGFARAKIVIMVFIVGSLLAVSYYLHNSLIFAASLVASAGIAYALLTPTFKEKRFFIVYLTYLVFCGCVILFR